MLIPSTTKAIHDHDTSLSRRVNANSQLGYLKYTDKIKLIKKGEC